MLSFSLDAVILNERVKERTTWGEMSFSCLHVSLYVCVDVWAVYLAVHVRVKRQFFFINLVL